MEVIYLVDNMDIAYRIRSWGRKTRAIGTYRKEGFPITEQIERLHTIPPLTRLEEGFPSQRLYSVSQKEANSRRPIYQIHKWWARRLGTVVRMLLLCAFSSQDESDSDLWDKFYGDATIPGKIVCDVMMGGGTRVLTFGMREIEPLYGPPVNESSLSVLFSIMDYVIRYRQFPNVEAIREHHFNNLRLRDQPNAERKRRAWIGKEDSKYTVALYSSLRTLDRRGLIVRELKEGPRRQIQSIKPTENGILSIVFSDLLQRFSDAEEIPMAPEEEPLSEEEY
jgi:hypothetical protein